MKNRFFSSTILIVILSVVLGCSSSKEIEINTKKALPAWYINPPKTTSDILYATAEGTSRDEAAANALSMMASTLSVSVSSQFSSKKVVKEGLQNSIDSTVSSQVQSDVKKIRIASYEILNSEEIGFKKHIVLIKSDKQKLFLSFKNDLEQRFAMIESDIKLSKKHGVLSELKSYTKAHESMRDIPHILTIMNVLKSSFDSKEYIEAVDKIENGYSTLLASVSFEIRCDEESKNLEAHVRDALISKKLHIKNGSGERHFTLSVTSDIQKASSYGFLIIRSAIEITLKDSKGSILSNKKLNITAQSTQNYEIAKEGIALKFGEIIKKEGIGKIVDLEL